MRKMLWLLGASVMLLPVFSQGAIVFRLVPGPTPVLPVGETQEGYVDLIAEPGSAADAAEPIDGYNVTVGLIDPTGRVSFISPLFAKRTSAIDLGSPPALEVPQARQIQEAAGAPIILNRNTALTSKTINAQQLNLGDQPEALGTGGGVIRIPFTVTGAQPGDTYQFFIDPSSALLSLTSANADPSTLGLPTAPIGPDQNASFTVVPEPASLGLLALGGLLGLRRRRSA